MKILAFSASNSSQSINRMLVHHAADVLRSELMPEAEIETLDLSDYEMPIYSMDREVADGIPELARQFRARIAQADALLISFAEHNGHYTAAYKNIFDWASRLEGKVYAGKPMVALSASPGPGGAASVLAAAKTSAPYFGSEIRGSLGVANFGTAFDAQAGVLTDPELARSLREALGGLTTQMAEPVSA
ncbi:NAD(P)H-dependent oxidoreductase [Allopontixanthobacter sp.]|uniref:NADPH-dependent FMN reductase n=1 Tax=Allopontixanthobacter sp. TaxID=2906452 RepID=UPI002ABB4391|nr:NAD(P)H-dependent oxidoreductase [Allopontixanthobacter sp.]MDZ4308759.1 NAD(P)H-dependent oxidoreductase [Allopontixanthobacter sp.]